MVDRGRVGNVTLVPSSLVFRDEAVLQIEVCRSKQYNTIYRPLYILFAHKKSFGYNIVCLLHNAEWWRWYGGNQLTIFYQSFCIYDARIKCMVLFFSFCFNCTHTYIFWVLCVCVCASDSGSGSTWYVSHIEQRNGQTSINFHIQFFFSLFWPMIAFSTITLIFLLLSLTSICLFSLSVHLRISLMSLCVFINW